MRGLEILVVALLPQIPGVLLAQNQGHDSTINAANYEFDAVSLKPDKTSRTLGPGEFSAAQLEAARVRGGPGTADPERITATGITLQGLITAAYNVLSEQVSGPGWIADEKYTLDAKVPSGATKEQAKLMLQKTLAERFKLALHHEQKVLQKWELGIVKDGAKLKAAADQNARPQMSVQARDGVRHDVYTAFRISRTDPNDSSVALDRILSSYLAATGMVPAGTIPDIVDKTGLAGRYDFSLEYAAPAARDSADTGGPTLLAALEKQLGLTLEQKKTPLDVLVIDHAERVPAEN